MNTDKTQPIDEESKEFIKWSINRLSDKEFYREMLERIESQMQALYGAENDLQLLRLLEAKMIAGAREHGKPLTDREQIAKEIQQELLDLIGWNMVELWREEKSN